MAETILILLLTQILAMMSPGPDMFLILKNSLGQPGQKAALFTILGIAVGLSVHITLSIAGLAIILIQSESLYRIVRYAGAAYLAYIGLKSLLSHYTLKIEEAPTNETRGSKRAFRQGLLTNLLNPKVTLFILSLFTQLISPMAPIWQKMTYGTVLILEAILVWWIFAMVINHSQIRKRIEKCSIWFDRLFGLILLCLAGSVIVFG